MTDEELLRLINLSQQPGRSDKVLASNFAVVASELYAKRIALDKAENRRTRMALRMLAARDHVAVNEAPNRVTLLNILCDDEEE